LNSYFYISYKPFETLGKKKYLDSFIIFDKIELGIDVLDCLFTLNFISTLEFVYEPLVLRLENITDFRSNCDLYNTFDLMYDFECRHKRNENEWMYGGIN